MGVVLIGTVHSSYRVLETLIDLQVTVDAVLSLSPEDAVGVSDYADLRPLAERHGIAHAYIKQVNSPDVVAHLRALEPDVIFVIGWSQLVKEEIIRLPRYGCVGAHPALLPRNRGRAAIPWSIINGDQETGMTLFYIDAGTDSGDIIAQTALLISESDTADTIYTRAVEALCDMLRTHMSGILTGTAPRIPQDESMASYCAKRVPDDGLIDWTRSTRHILNLIRAVTRPYPGAFTYWRQKKVIIWSAVAGDEEWAALPGQLLRRDPERGVLMKTGDGTLWVTETEVDGQAVRPMDVFRRVGEKAGPPDVLSLMRRIEELEARITALEGSVDK